MSFLFRMMKHLIVYLCLPIFLCNMAAAAESPFRFVNNKDKKQLTIMEAETPILTYQYDVIEHENVPASDPRRTAGCYVHPLYGLNGEILTDNAATDHYHHHGVFWTWPHVGVHEQDGTITEYDLWTSNTALKQHFVCWMKLSRSEQAATVEVENGWYIGNPLDNKKIMTERVWITAHGVREDLAGTLENVKSRAVDFAFRWQPLDNPLSLRGSEGKSYGGFSVRFKPFVPVGKTEAERSEINKITIPTGIAENDLPETPLAWADYTSTFGVQPSGAAIFVPKAHPDFPPTWLTRYYGPLCVGYPGVKGRTLQANEILYVHYRIWIHEGSVTVPQIEKAYEEYNK